MGNNQPSQEMQSVQGKINSRKDTLRTIHKSKLAKIKNKD